jgi:hypothetical protein
MPRRTLALLAFLLAALLAIPSAIADPATPAESNPATGDTTFPAPFGPGTEDLDTGGLDASVPTTLFKCLIRYEDYTNRNLRVAVRSCIQRRDDTYEKRTRASISCRRLSDGVLTTCHFWWSDDPFGNTPYRRYYVNINTLWVQTAGTSPRSACLNCTSSIAYSLWANDEHNMYVYGRFAVGVTLHGGVYAWPFVKNSGVLLDG